MSIPAQTAVASDPKIAKHANISASSILSVWCTADMVAVTLLPMVHTTVDYCPNELGSARIFLPALRSRYV